MERWNRQRARGFTLIELLTAMTVAAILMMLGAPAMGRLLQSVAVSGAVNSFLADLRLARSEAIRRGGYVTLCRSETPEEDAAACADAPDSTGRGWASGWIVFHDVNGNGDRDAAEPLLHAQAAVTNVDSIAQPGSAAKFQFTALGRTTMLGSMVSLRFGDSAHIAADIRRTVCVGISGRARVLGGASTSCEADG